MHDISSLLSLNRSLLVAYGRRHFVICDYVIRCSMLKSSGIATPAGLISINRTTIRKYQSYESNERNEEEGDSGCDNHFEAPFIGCHGRGCR